MNFLGKTINNIISFTASQSSEEVVDEDHSKADGCYKEENISSDNSSDEDSDDVDFDDAKSTKNKEEEEEVVEEDDFNNMSIGATTNVDSKISELTESSSFNPSSVEPVEFTRHAKGVYKKKINRKTLTDEEEAQLLWEEAVNTYFNGDEERAKKYQTDYFKIETKIKSLTGGM